MNSYKDQHLSPEDRRLGLGSERIGWLFAIGAVLATTLAAAPLWFFVDLHSLLLLYVLAVVVTGLRHGSGPALLAAFLGLIAHNFFFTTPLFGFGLPHPDDVSSLIFLFLIALACGPVASRIRQQFIQLRQSNRYLEALRLLGQDLSVAENGPAVWVSTTRELRGALLAESCVLLLRDEEGGYQGYPSLHEDLGARDMEAVAWTLEHGAPSGRFNGKLEASAWSVFPVTREGAAIAAAAIRFDPGLESLQSYDRQLIVAMLQQASDTWGRVQLSDELESARVQAEMEQLRSALLSSVSHDLKSPLSALMGAAETMSVLDRQLPSEDRLELVGMILQESHRLDSYIQNLMDMTRLENGALKIERDWVSISDLAGSAIARLKRYFPSARIECHAMDSFPLLYVNPALLEQALFNILENGLKFSPPNEAIRITAQSDDEVCRIAIEDKGPGIPEHLREPIFDMFYVISEGDHKKPGTGMGLAICRGMVAANGGRVWAEEGRGGKGTRFVVELPVVHPESVDNETSEENT